MTKEEIPKINIIVAKEEILKRAFEAYPSLIKCVGAGKEFDENSEKREGYIKALTEMNNLQKIEGWVARDEDGMLNVFQSKPSPNKFEYGDKTFHRWDDFETEGRIELPETMFPEITWESEPFKVELLIKTV